MPLDFAVSRTVDSASEMQVRVGGAGQARRHLDRCGYGCWVLVRYGMESGHQRRCLCLASLVFEQLVYAVFAHDSYVGRAERVRRFLRFSHTPFIFATTEDTKPSNQVLQRRYQVKYYPIRLQLHFFVEVPRQNSVIAI